MSARQLIEFHIMLQAQKTFNSGLPRTLHASLSTEYTYRTRNAANGNIRLGVPAEVKSGNITTVKRNLKQ